MGGLGSHHAHPYALQTAAFLASLMLPGLVLLLVGGAYLERFRRRERVPAVTVQVTGPLVLTSELSAE